MALNIYKTSYCIDAYSKDQEMSDPIFNASDFRFDGISGQMRDIHLFLKNDGSFTVVNIVINPHDLDLGVENLMMKLSETLIGLDSATPGEVLEVPDLDPSEVYDFWYRCTVDAGTSEEIMQNLALRIDATESS